MKMTATTMTASAQTTKVTAMTTSTSYFHDAIRDCGFLADVAERCVDSVENALVDAAEEGENALRQFGDNEAEDDGDEH